MPVSPESLTPQQSQRFYRQCLGMFLGFFAISLALAMLPLYVHITLGFGDVLVGLAVGIQFLATIATRVHVGKIADRLGAKRVMLAGFKTSFVAAIVFMGIPFLPFNHNILYVLILFARLISGYAESQLVTGMLAWAISTLGSKHAGKVMSWTGMAIYTALAAGAPIGIVLYQFGGLFAVGATMFIITLCALAITYRVQATPANPSARTTFASVVRFVFTPGLGLALQGVGFASIGAFVVLHFEYNGWSGAGLVLTAFGLAFGLVRIFFGHLPTALGAARVATYAMIIEGIGLTTLFAAHDPTIAIMGAAITGMGSSLVFPALGIIVVNRSQPSNRATALGTYGAFQDISYGLTGPLIGLLTGTLGYASAFLIGAISAFAGSVVAYLLYKKVEPEA